MCTFLGYCSHPAQPIDRCCMQHQSGATKYGFIKFSDPSVIDGIVERKVGLFALCFGVMVNEQEIVCAGVSIPLERASRRPSNNYSAPPQQQYQQSYSEPEPKRHADRVFCKVTVRMRLLQLSWVRVAGSANDNQLRPHAHILVAVW